ncbi:pyridoxamine 5'-phosphate oxidase family protein [Aestuariivirga litoralis]|uniref:pyridoxamine 5'-phosphate oxidase family protein n=1 Tax=Aestuariivirga litoralis TaxID=2650924 RepID=UPI0018C4A028|nr:pyridoxamine 5'-phosphate oxidase family protein [Aestuariivirga litoralis]MBG1233470.1 pyridoxamine 5-phosphate oxidase [Aestuariivirga litoralis]
MPRGFSKIAFTAPVRDLQERDGSRKAYARFESGPETIDRIGPAEAAFIAARDSFYMATVSENGWPYIQHRGGPAGFLRVLSETEIGFADYSGNRQFISTGNLAGDDRVSLFLMDYPHRTRLKILGHARVVNESDTATMAKLAIDGYKARVQRGIIITMEGFDWNCPQHITPRFTAAEAMALTGERAG